MKLTSPWLPRMLPVLLCIVPFGHSAQEKPRFATDSEEQYNALAELMKQNSYSISLQDGKLLLWYLVGHRGAQTS